MTENLLDQSNEEPKSYLDALVGDNKKFKDQEALARGKWESDQYIKTKEAEFDKLRDDYLKLRDDYNARAKLEEVLDQVLTSKQQQQTSSDNTRTANDVKPMPTIDPNQIKSLVSNTVQEIEMTKRQTENFNMVKDTLSEKFGSNFQTHLREAINSLGMSEQEANDMAKRNPKAFLKLMDSESTRRDTFQAPPQTQQRSSSFAPKTTRRDNAYYEDLRTKNPAVYWDPKTQVQLHRDISEQSPEVFYNDPNWIMKT